MNLPVKFAEVSPRQGIPVPVPVGPPLVLRQELQLLHIVRVGLHQVPVVVHRGGNEAVVRRILSRPELPVQKQPLHPGVTHTPRVAGEVDPLGNGIDPPHTGRQSPELLLGKIGGLVQKQPVIALPLVLALHRGPIAWQVPKFHPRSVAQGENPVGAVVRGRPRWKQAQQRPNEGVFHFVKLPAHQKNLDSRILPGPTRCLPHHRPALSPSPGPAVAGVFRPAEEKPPLRLRIGPAQINLHPFLHGFPPLIPYFCSILREKIKLPHIGHAIPVHCTGGGLTRPPAGIIGRPPAPFHPQRQRSL